MASGPEVREKEMHGVTVRQTKLQGKWYTTVDSRVKIAEQANPELVRRKEAGYSVRDVRILPVGDRWAYTCMVEYPIGSNVWTPGSDFIDVKDATGLAKAETSAIGRALGLHGIAIEESIASLDEMRRVAPGAEDSDEPAASSSNPAPVKPQPKPPAQSASDHLTATITQFKIGSEAIKAMRLRHDCAATPDGDAKFADLVATEQGKAELLCSNFFGKHQVLHRDVIDHMAREGITDNFVKLAQDIKADGLKVLADIHQFA